MGSLMAGWNSPNKKFHRTLSLTKDEIDHYWRNKRLDQSSGHEEAVSPCSPRLEAGKKPMQKSNTFTSSDDDHLDHRRAIFVPVTSQKEVLKSKTFNGREAEVDKTELMVGSAPAAWWTKTDLAFLNERPVLEVVEGGGGKFKYTAQHSIGGRLQVPGSSSNSAVVF